MNVASGLSVRCRPMMPGVIRFPSTVANATNMAGARKAADRVGNDTIPSTNSRSTTTAGPI